MCIQDSRIQRQKLNEIHGARLIRIADPSIPRLELDGSENAQYLPPSLASLRNRADPLPEPERQGFLDPGQSRSRGQPEVIQAN